MNRLQLVAERFGVEDYDPLVQALETVESMRRNADLTDTVLSIDEKTLYIQTQLRLAEYVHPKIKAADPTSDTNQIDEVKLELASRIMSLLDGKG